jgi:hypothetical protein
MPPIATAAFAAILDAIGVEDGGRLSVVGATREARTVAVAWGPVVGCSGCGDSLGEVVSTIGVPGLAEQAATRSAPRVRGTMSLNINESSLWLPNGCELSCQPS